MDPEVLYFGCLGRPGHHLRSKRAPQQPAWYSTPWGRQIDGGLLPQGTLLPVDVPDREGVVHCHHKDGWTVINFYDRSGDSRFGSHSAFLIAQSITATELLALARLQWPEIFKRIQFPLVPAKDTLR